MEHSTIPCPSHSLRLETIFLGFFFLVTACGQAPEKITVATLNGEAITARDVQDQLDHMVQVNNQSFLDAEDAREKALGALIIKKLIVEQARKSGLVSNIPSVPSDEMMQSIVSNSLSRASLPENTIRAWRTTHPYQSALNDQAVADAIKRELFDNLIDLLRKNAKISIDHSKLDKVNYHAK